MPDTPLSLRSRVNLLKSSPLADAGLRLLTDLAERCPTTSLTDEPHTLGPGFSFVLRGMVRRAQSASWLGPGALLQIPGPGSESVDSVLPTGELTQLLQLDPQTARFVGLLGSSGETETLQPCRLHLLWITKPSRVEAPILALTHLLAAGLEDQFGEDEGVAILACNDEATPPLQLSRMSGGRLVSIAPVAGPLDETSLAALLGTEFKFNCWHILVVNPSRPTCLPGLLDELQFDRLLVLSDKVTSCPPSLANRLKPIYRPTTSSHETWFSSFVPSLLRRAESGCCSFNTIAVMDDVALGDLERDENWRARRDSCRVFFDLQRLEYLWNDARATQCASSFARSTFNDSPRTRAIAHRWARAVTNRRVGIALSGGGASSYRLAPIFERFRSLGIPIDVVSGVSGGATLGAYFCAREEDGIELCQSIAPRFLPLVLAATVSSEVVRIAVDHDLDGKRVEDLDVPLVALTAALCDPPASHAVVAGTLGEALQVSGSFPLAFGSTRKNSVNYLDGSIASPLPARVLREFGADVVFAFNSVPGPKLGSILPRGSLATALYRWTLLGRVIDTWVASAFFLRRAAKEMARDAYCFYEPDPVEMPLLESLAYLNTRSRAQASLRDERFCDAMNDCARVWADLRRRTPWLP